MVKITSKDRKTPLNSKKKIISAILLYEMYVDEPISSINICTSTRYLFNGKWSVDIQSNRVDISYPDPDW
jgi:hypothetical protein